MQVIKDKDSGGFDICQVNQKTLEEMYQLMQFIPYAEGFNSAGWIKYHISSELQDSPASNLFKIKNRTDMQDQLYSNQIPKIYCICEPDRPDKLEFMKMQNNENLNIIFTEESNQKIWPTITDTTVFINDTVSLCKDFYEKLNHLMALLEKISNWDIVYLGFTFKNEHEKELWNEKFPKIKPLDQSLITDEEMIGYIVTPTGLKKIMENSTNLQIYMIIPHLIKKY